MWPNAQADGAEAKTEANRCHHRQTSGGHSINGKDSRMVHAGRPPSSGVKPGA